MQQVYAARNSMEAHFLQSLLAAEGIESIIQGAPLGEVWGDVALTPQMWPSVWVNEADVPRARPIVDEYDRRTQSRSANADAPPRATWKCPKCGEMIEEQFTRCWHCNTARPEAKTEG
jgi:predicted RNA-binding Zn-ribbon protein involved in translation (DUF1610 family)